MNDSRTKAPSGAFTFATDVRAEQHRANFEAKLAHWEIRTQEAIRQANQIPVRFQPVVHHVPIPDYPTLQQQHHNRVQAARVAARTYVTAPKTPGLKTKRRVVDRRYFDEQIKEKERLLQSQRDAQLHEEEARTQQELKILRRKLDENVKANPIPHWYQDRRQPIEVDGDSD